MDQQKTTVEMTAEELELFNEAKAAKAKKDAAGKENRRNQDLQKHG